MNAEHERSVSWWAPVLFAALAGGMAWGIRGQYGHETGAMMAGLLVSATLVFLLAPSLPLLNAARAIAMCTVAMGFGGSMTYGVTLGLSHNPEFIGNWDTLRWGLLGCAIKGGVWIGFAAVFLGMGLGGVRYRAAEILMVMLAMLGAYFIGVRLFNYPFNPAAGDLPAISFSDFNRWDPETTTRPRREQWGGLWLALITITAYARFHRGDRLAGRLARWGILGGALGFSFGQSLQAFHAWNPEVFDQGFWVRLDPHINWWNTMETTFGAVMGAFIGLGLWLNRGLIQTTKDWTVTPLSYPTELLLLAVHVPLLIAVEFLSIGQIDALYDLGLILAIIPMVGLVGGRAWPYLVIFPVILIPIAGKTLRHVSERVEVTVVTDGIASTHEELIILPIEAFLYVALPLLFSTAVFAWFLRRDPIDPVGKARAGALLLIPAWTFFLLNYVVFDFPFPWRDWTSRMPSGIVFTVCIAALTVMVVAGTVRARGRAKTSPAKGRA